ncbi:hypothetical protein Q4577_03465 [Marinovum sp. 2_MG-2023]|nr:hypothetical protein [Marinovum sp. 2_MG-2023]MDO6779311.1 hypothetical protein [Marinovum sp. 1_MG-2023]
MRAFSATRLEARRFSISRSALSRVFCVVRSRVFVFDRPITVDVDPATADIAVLVMAASAVIVWLATKKPRKSKKVNMRAVVKIIRIDPIIGTRVFLIIFTNQILYVSILNLKPVCRIEQTYQWAKNGRQVYDDPLRQIVQFGIDWFIVGKASTIAMQERSKGALAWHRAKTPRLTLPKTLFKT